MTTFQGFIALDTAKNEKPCAGNRKNKQLYHMCNNNSPLKTFIPQSRPSLPTLTCLDTLLNLKKRRRKKHVTQHNSGHIVAQDNTSCRFYAAFS